MGRSSLPSSTSPGLPGAPRSRTTAARFASLILRLVWLGLARLVSRARCAGCAAALRRRAVFCPTCALTVAWPEPGHGPPAAATFGGAVRTAIHRLKYEGRVEAAGPLAHVLLARLDVALEFEGGTFDRVVPVPLHPARLAERGYNQSALVSSIVARELGVRHRPRALQRDRATAAQAKLGRADRLENVRGAFSARERVDGLRVLLIDDVTTTGATLAAAREALLAAGAREVIPFAIAVQP